MASVHLVWAFSIGQFFVPVRIPPQMTGDFAAFMGPVALALGAAGFMGGVSWLVWSVDGGRATGLAAPAVRVLAVMLVLDCMGCGFPYLVLQD